jgi:hypothetical protein
LNPTPRNSDVRRQRLAVGLIGALVLLLVLWETVLAPVRPGGSWIALKALPLALVCWESRAEAFVCKSRRCCPSISRRRRARGDRAGRHAVVADSPRCVAACRAARLFRNGR